MIENISKQLPTNPGFYWWRLNSEKPWRMVRVVLFGEPSKSFRLMTYDVQEHEWCGLLRIGYERFLALLVGLSIHTREHFPYLELGEII